MNAFSRYPGGVGCAHERVQQLRREADTQRLVQAGGFSPAWRTRLAAQLHALAERLEPDTTRAQASAYQRPQGKLL